MASRRGRAVGAGIGIEVNVLQRLTTWLWSFIVLLIVLLAVYSSVGRLLMNNVARYQGEILETANAHLPFILEIDDLSGSWRSLSPRLEARGLRILGDSQAPVGLEFSSLLLELDVLDTLRTMSPRLFTLTAGGGRIHVDVDDQGQLSIAGIPGGGQGNFGRTLNEFIFNVEELTIDELAMELDQGESTRVSFIQAEVLRDGNFRRASVSLRAPDRDAWFRLTAEGEGSLTDFRSFSGLFHLKSELGDIALFDDLLAQIEMLPVTGHIENDLWLRFDEGKVRVATRLAGEAIELKPLEGEGQAYNLERVGLDLAADYRDQAWDFRARDIELIGAGRSVLIPALTGRYGDDSISLRLADIELGQLSSYLQGAGLLPETAQDVLSLLSPTGELEQVEFTLRGIQTGQDWTLSTNFRDVDVEPWRGAPGLTNASGFAVLTADRGRVQLASSEFSMAFPKVFRRHLDYQSFSAELQWTVEPDAFRLRSGPFTAFADEGEVKGLFSMLLPRVETAAGAEMDLMVSLRDTAPQYRRKYLPYKLNPNLLEWLEPSIGEGRISEGGFIYRGSLVRNPAYRTMQLFFDVEDTRIDYHPEWPAIDDLEGLVLIDDADVDVYAQRGRILDSEVSDVRVQLRQDADKQLHLALTAAMRGSAADGLAVVNTSPLRNTVGDTFIDWTLGGELDTQLALAMNLSDASIEPRINLVTRWSGVNVDMGELDLSVDGVSGTLFYDSYNGFRADDMTGSAWGRPIVGRVSQGRAGDVLAPLDIEVRGGASASDVRTWLDLDMLQLAEGEADAVVHVRVPADGAAMLEVDSMLEGVALDLPTPWAKQDSEARPMRLSMPLAAGPKRIDIVMDEAAFLGLDVDAVGLTGGSLGFSAPVAASEPGRILLGGQIDFLDWAEWEAFFEQYFPEDEAAPEILTSLQGLDVAELLLFGKQIYNVRLDGLEYRDRWEIDFETVWSAGRVVLPEDLSRVDVDLERLEIGGFTDMMNAEEGLPADDFDFPPIAVTVADLHEADDHWGNLAFTLRQSGSNLHFENIRGELRRLILGRDKPMRLDWLRGETGELTRLMGELNFVNFGDVLEQYQYEQIVETNSGNVGLELTWPGDPTDFALVETSGRMTLDVQEGSFLNTSGATSGTLRVVAILNLAEFVNKLSLDLSHVYKSGVPFDSIEGELIFDAGLIEVPGIDVRGRGSRFQFVGVADARAETIDGEMVATLPIASNLPWMFALVSGLPAAAGVYVISKVFNKQMDRFSSAVYRVDGAWADPQLNFQRIFDNSARERKKQTAGNPGEGEQIQTADSAKSLEETAPAAEEEKKEEEEPETEGTP